MVKLVEIFENWNGEIGEEIYLMVKLVEIFENLNGEIGEETYSIKALKILWYFGLNGNMFQHTKQMS